ncbi:hypothetical protein PHISP_05990 [Aspergillus sp. HF37]|nr:hypothetical protein PHISP_05990 [Aspergillus sp. HF37]
MKSREALSVSHCLLIVSATLFELYRQSEHWVPPAWRGMRSNMSRLDIIDKNPRFTCSIIAFECGYLLQDFVVLVRGARLVAGDGRARSIMARNVNWRVLGWHHLGLAAGLGLFHLRAVRGTAKGSLVVLMMMLMNASTPFGTLHWFLARFHPARRASICASHVMYLVTYALARVYLFYGILGVFGAWKGGRAREALAHLRWQCHLGIGVITGVNAFWLLGALRKFARTYLIRGGK